MTLQEKWLKLLSDYAYIKEKSDETSSGYPEFIAQGNAIINELHGVINSILDIPFNADGGTPYTKIIDSSTDCNGGYPGL